jgi:membrane protease YdiL (CAAX protease family)
MNIDEIKTEWKQYSKKLEVSQRLNEHLILSMLKERSRSRVSKIRRNNTIYFVLMLLTLLFLVAIFAGNPFDFKYRLQYIPYGILFIGVLLAIISLVKSFKTFTTNINSVSLDNFLKRTIEEYDKNKKIERWFGVIIFSAGLLTAFSFLPKKLEHKEFWQAIGETAVSMLITIAIYFIAFKLGAFKNKNKGEFENDLKEWNELKNISMELNDK